MQGGKKRERKQKENKLPKSRKDEISKFYERVRLPKLIQEQKGNVNSAP